MSNGDAGQTNLAPVQRICDRCVLKATIEAARPYVYVTIEEVPQRKWGLTGHPLSDPDFLISINDLVPIFEDAADVFSTRGGAHTSSRLETQF